MQSLCSRPGLTPAGCGDSAEFSGIGVFHESVGCLTAPETAALADAAGVPRRTAERARRNRGIGSEAYLKLCNAVGKDAVSGAPRTVRFMPSAACNWWLLGAAIYLARSRRLHGIRAAALEIGVSTATLSRAETGQAIAIESVIRIAHYLQLTPEAAVGLCERCPTVTAPATRETSEQRSLFIGDAELLRAKGTAEPSMLARSSFPGSAAIGSGGSAAP
jgi:hypothetical protein